MGAEELSRLVESTSADRDMLWRFGQPRDPAVLVMMARRGAFSARDRDLEVGRLDARRWLTSQPPANTR
jgi:hypothetical protein